jgi:DNA-binding NarL/FixJ family response regulator
MNCVHTVATGGAWMQEDLFGAAGRPVRGARSPLTLREMQVMELVERGLKNREIGGQLGIQTGTVKIHLKHIFEKTGIRGRYGLALSGLKEKGLLAVVVE